MKKILISILSLALMASCASLKKSQPSTQSPDLALLVQYMEGSFSSEEHAKQDTTYLHITLDMKQIWKDREDGAWLYVEQTAAWTPGKPYRQRIYHLEQVGENEFTSTICSMEHPEKFIGGHRNPKLFNGLSPDSIDVLQGCTIYLTYKDGIFSGSTRPGECLNSWGEASYATSEVVISPDLLISWDRGWNDKNEQVWGAEKGGYRFKKVK